MGTELDDDAAAVAPGEHAVTVVYPVPGAVVILVHGCFTRVDC